jgi:tetratricopeptide (TPR) repeat protein
MSKPEHVLDAFVAMGADALESGQYQIAETMYRAALRETSSGLPSDPRFVTVFGNLAILCKRQKRYRKAEDLFKKAIKVSYKILGPQNETLGNLLCQLADLCTIQARYLHAERLYKRALAIFENSPAGKSDQLFQICDRLCFIAYARGKRAEAIKWCKRAVAASETSLKNQNSNSDFLSN